MMRFSSVHAKLLFNNKPKCLVILISKLARPLSVMTTSITVLSCNQRIDFVVNNGDVIYV